MTVEKRLAEHVAGLRFDRLPAEVRAAAERFFLDTLAAMLSGFANAGCRAIVERLLKAGGTGRSTVVGQATGAGAGWAALANGIYAHWCEWDDVHDAAGIHGSAVIYPVVMAAAEAAGDLAPGEFVAALVAAYDVAARIGEAMNDKSFHGWMTTGAAASIGAAAGAARLMGLDADGILSAMGIAATGGGLGRQPLADRTNGKNALCGMAAVNAMNAAELARAGIVGAPNFFAGPFGINALHAGGRADLEPLLGDLGARFCIAEASAKPYPSCRSTHAAIDLVLDRRADDPGFGDAVRSADFVVPPLPYSLCGRPFEPGENPRVSAQFSIPFTVALALTREAMAPRDFEPERVLAFAAERGDLIAAVTVRQIEGGAGLGQATVPVSARFRCKDGRVVERSTSVIKGSAKRPMTPEEERNKLVTAASAVLTGRDLDDLCQAVALSSTDGLSRVIGILRRAGRGRGE